MTAARSRWLRLVLGSSVVGMAIAPMPQALAQLCPAWLPGPMAGFGIGTNGIVRAMTTWDHDGFPATPQWLVIAGQFTTAGGVPAKNIAAWDGSAWRALGTGITNAANNAQVFALTVYNGELIAGGQFTQAGSVFMDTNVARWNGSAWQNLGSGSVGPSYQSNAYALTVFNGELMIGSHNFIGGTAIAVRKWHPTNGWGSRGNFTGTGIVRALEVYNGRLYAGGHFTKIDGVDCDNIASTDGSTWLSPPGGGVTGGTGEVQSLNFNPFNNWLTVTGSFSFVGSQPRNNVAFLNSVGWLPINSGTESGGLVLSSISTPDASRRVIMTGVFGGEYVIRRWDGTAWHTMLDDINGATQALHVHDPLSGGTIDDMVLVAGGFSSITTLNTTVTVNNIAHIVDGQSVIPLHNASPIRAMVNYNTGFIVAGDFTHPTLGGVQGRHLVRWDGTNLRTVEPFPNPLNAEGTNAPVHALRTQNIGISSRNLYIGGDFTVAGDILANRIARYNTSTQFAGASFTAMGAGFNARVATIELHNSEIYAGGFFTHSGGTVVNYVARWNSATSTWQSLAGGLNGFVYALKSYNGELYAAGTFTFSGAGAVMPRIARWNGTAWNSVNTLGMNGTGVFALAIHDGSLVAGGDFNAAGGIAANSVAKWNGSTWAPIGPGLTGVVNTLVVSPTNTLIAGGRFNAGPFLENVAYFNGSNWLSMQFNNSFKGPEDRIYALAYRGTELQAGGQFRVVQNYPQFIPTPNWARAIDYSQPVFTQQPIAPPPACPGDQVAFSVQLAPEFAGFNYQWARNGVDLANGTTASGSIISGATTSALTISNIGNGDAGSYSCRVQGGGCGHTWSQSAQLTLDPACACPQDTNGDGVINVTDLLAVIGAWGACPPPCPPDVNNDGNVNVTDLLAVISAWGACP